MDKLDEIRLLVKGIRQLKEERQSQIESMTEQDPFTTLESIFDKLNRYDNLVACLIKVLWDKCDPTKDSVRGPYQ